MTDRTAPAPVPGIVDLHARLAGRRDPLRHVRRCSARRSRPSSLGRAGFDWVIIDLEHGAGDRSRPARQPPRRRAPRRPPRSSAPQSGERLRIGRALDLGAHGIMVPRVDLPDQAREAISFMRYPPDGVRGLALSTRGAGPRRARPHRHPGDQPTDRSGSSRSNRRARSSTPRRSPRSTASTSCSSGRPTCRTASAFPGSFDDPGYLAALERVVAAAEAAGKAAGILLRDAAGPAAPPRARLPVHRPRLGRGVHQRRRAGRAGGRPGLTLRPSRRSRGHAPDQSPPGRSFVGDAHASAPAPARPLGPVWATTTPIEDQRATDQLDGRQGHGTGSRPGRSSRSARRWLISDACAAPTRRAPA